MFIDNMAVSDVLLVSDALVYRATAQIKVTVGQIVSGFVTDKGNGL